MCQPIGVAEPMPTIFSLMPFFTASADTRREEVDDVGGAGGERLLPGRAAAIGGDLGLDTVLLVVAELVGRIDRRIGSVVGNGKPDLDRGLGVGIRDVCQQCADDQEIRS